MNDDDDDDDDDKMMIVVYSCLRVCLHIKLKLFK